MTNTTPSETIDTGTICPVSGLPVEVRPEWTDRRFGRWFRLSVRLIGDRILLVKPTGHVRCENVRRSLAMTDAIIRDRIKGASGFVQITDYSGLRSISRNARLHYMEHVNRRGNLLGQIYYHVNPLFRVMINLGKRLRPPMVDIHIVKNYAAAVQMALDRLAAGAVGTASSLPADAYAKLGITVHHEEGRHILRCDRWRLDLEDYHVSVEVIDGCIYHARSSGLLREHHVTAVSQLRERVRDMLRLDGGFCAIVTGTADNQTGNRKARLKYMASLRKWHERYPVALYVFYNANWFIRGAAMLAIPFMPFAVKVVPDLACALTLLDRSIGTAPSDGATVLMPESEAEDPLHIVHRLLQFIGDIDWEGRGGAPPARVPTDHPFRPVFDAVALIKGELDELFDERRLSERRLRESQRRFDEVLTYSLDALYKRDLKTGAFDYVSDAVDELFGIPPETVRRLGFDGIKHMIHPDDRPRYDAFNAKLLNATMSLPPGEHLIHYRLKTTQGIYRWFSESQAIVMDDAGQPASIIGSIRDISRVKQLEAERLKIAEQFQQTRKMEAVSTMAGGVAHNFSNLLMVVLGNLEMMRIEAGADDRRIRKIRAAENSAQRAADLSTLMLTYLGQAQIDPRHIDLNTTVSEMLDVLKTTLAERATLMLAPAKDEAWIHADTGNVCQVITNMVTNAVEASGDLPPIIQLTVGRHHLDVAALSRLETGGEPLAPGPYVWLQVSDNGSGMDAETLEKVLDPFFTTKFAGRGLGMATVMGIMRAHQGAVQVDSRPGQGTTGIVYFPQAKPIKRPVPDKPVTTRSVASRSRGTALLVDDEPLVLELGGQMLGLLGFEVVTAADGAEALAVFTAHRDQIRLALLDINMVQMGGRETLTRLRQMGASFPVLVASAYTEAQARELMGDIAIDAFIKKPYRVDHLQEKIEGIFDLKY